ncbi:helix-turn-helix domain-containing protein [Mesorhizobium sp. 1M-11]|uniref:ArsR/SmtB family transcription factor n=1 Tax=Mesorhizobium sp. 1M-11 TaxID=1529006 RepID=UPI0006C752B0|nr:helix-turn-helix domain-containing protein [Mesorhizobium sp. 1M-11]
MFELEVIDAPAAAAVALDPIKTRLLAELSEPSSAASLAERVGLTRQKVNYHLRVLEHHKLIEAVEERRWGGLTERLMVATASSYVVSPAALGPIGADPARNDDRLSASYLIALAARVVREVGELWRCVRQTDKGLATLSIDTVIRFRSPADRATFTVDLTNTVSALAARYHDASAPGGRPHRLVVASYPAPPDAKP